MNTFKILIIGLLVTALFTSCSEEPTIEISTTGDVELEALPGNDLEFLITLTSEVGISQIVAESPDLGIDYLNNPTVTLQSAIVELTASVPSDAVATTKYDIDVEVSDINGDREMATLILTVQ